MRSLIVILVLGLALASGVLSSENEPAPVKPDDFSVYPGSLHAIPTPPAVKENSAMPGGNALLKPMFVGAPPEVPHGIQDFLPITTEDNGCVACHFEEKDPEEDAPLLPESHHGDGRRWICTACHVPRTDAKPLLGD